MDDAQKEILNAIGRGLEHAKKSLGIGDVSEVHHSAYPLNWLIWGAPGTGKSHKLALRMKDFNDKNISRVTFYPTYTYQQFVGAYKPNMNTKDKDGKREINYSYVPGPFLRQLIKAIQNPKQDYLIIIEEINRANAAAVFGDVFQLLDRKADGSSEYPIEINEDMKLFFMDEDATSEEKIIKNATDSYEKLSIPSNLYIWATMNSADQGVFPLDTAFKRRWEYDYLGINTNDDLIENFTYFFKDGEYKWNSIRKAINAKLLSAKVNEDKLIGPFFITLNALGHEEAFMKAFRTKVLMYLFEDAIRHNPRHLFKDEQGQLSYSIICEHLRNGGLKDVFSFEIKHSEEKSKQEQNQEQVQDLEGGVDGQ